MIFLLYIDKKQKSVIFFNEIDSKGRCLKQLHSQTRSIVFEKGGGGGADSSEISWQGEKTGQIRENPNPGVGEGVLSLW